MRDATIYSATNVWTDEDASLAAALLRFVTTKPKTPDAQIVEAYAGQVVQQTEGSSFMDDAARVWHRLLTQFPHPVAVARARGTLQTFTPTKDSSAHAPQETPAPTELFYDGWSVKCADLQQFVDTAQTSPAVLQFFAQVLQAIPVSANVAAEASTTVANAFYLTQPDKHRERLRGLLRKARCVLAPALQKESDEWLLCTVMSEKTAGEVNVSCVVSHSNELAADERLKLEGTLERSLQCGSVTYRQ